MESGRKSDFEIIGIFAVGIAAGLFFSWVLWAACWLTSSVVWGRNVQTTYSKLGYSAELLKKHNLADMNLIVRLDGEKIYESPDLASCYQNDCHEFLTWDDTGHVLLLNVVGKNVFAYDTDGAHELAKGELARYKFSPPWYENRLLKDIDE